MERKIKSNESRAQKTFKRSANWILKCFDDLQARVSIPTKKNSPVLISILITLLLAYLTVTLMGSKEMEISYGEFLQGIKKEQVSNLTISEHQIEGLYNPTGTSVVPFVTNRLNDEVLANSLAAKHINFTVVSDNSVIASFLFGWLLPFMVIVGFWWLMMRFIKPGAMSGLLGQRRPIPPIRGAQNQWSFDNIAGTHEAKTELQETILFLKDPRRIGRLGGRMPKGVILIGAPGTGKTLLARAVAGEAGVPFFNISGSEFMEIFVGVGAARVRELFVEARKNAPCMIFIDELDAIGRSRSGPHTMLAHDEREQTLNQLLTEMDGFDPSSGIIVMAATNRPEILDRALLRAGRFDRQIVVDKPGLSDREEILLLHSKTLVLGTDVDLHVVAQRTAGLVGADLANICNEAAILAVRENENMIGMKQFESAIERIVTGPEKRSLVLSSEEKERVACHEAGHALVAALLPNAEPVHKVSIIPRGAATLGFTLQLPLEERFLSTEPQLHDQMAVLLAGRSAERLQFGSLSNGSTNDLEAATLLSKKMVCEWGMSPKIGPVSLGRRERLFFLEPEGSEERNFSEVSAEQIDLEIRRIMDDAQQRAEDLLIQHQSLLRKVMDNLIDREVIDGATISEWVGAEVSVPEIQQ